MVLCKVVKCLRYNFDVSINMSGYFRNFALLALEPWLIYEHDY